MKLDLNLAFPEPINPGVKRGPLPKQAEFLRLAQDPAGPKYIMYAGGVGSGKTLIGCITILTLAVQYPGDYLVCRLFNPELKITTYKTFLDICPPELILENRVADQIVKIRSAGGKSSSVIFRGLEEPNKHRSLNLNAAYIDEASQTSEAAFVLLQSRLRGPHIRKILMTTNPNGHSWLYKLFVKKDLPTEAAKRQFYCITAPSTENKHLPEGYVQSMLDTYSADRIQREILGSWDAFQGQIFSDFSRNTHVVKPFVIPPEWTRFVGMDHGFRNPACALWCAVDYDGTIYVYREWYHSEHEVKEIVLGSQRLGTKGLIEANGRDKIEGIWIDPSTRANRGKESDWDTYLDYIPSTWSLIPANNDVTASIDRIKTLLKPSPRTGKPQLFIFDSCVNLIEEIGQYRWAELMPGQESKQNLKEEPVKKDDHSVDALRYAIMSRPEAPKIEDKSRQKREEATLMGSIARELHNLRNPQLKDPFQDF